METQNLIIQEPQKQSSKGIIILFAYIIFIIAAISVIIFIIPRPEVVPAVAYMYIVWAFGFLFLFTYQHIIRHKVRLDVKRRKIRHIYTLSLLKFRRKWRRLSNLKYISVFKTNGSYQLNLWDESNTVSNVVTLKDYKDAFKKAFLIAKELNIGLLDATIKGSHKLINKDAYKNSGTVEYLD